LKLTGRSKNIKELYRDISELKKKSYQLRTNIIRDEKGGLVTGSHSISS
jgi:hypothetical protein